MRHAPMHRLLLLHGGGLLLLGNGFANLRGNTLRHAFESAHQGRPLDVFLDVRMPHTGARGGGWKLDHGHRGCCSFPASSTLVMLLLLRWLLVSVHRLHLTLRHRPATRLLHLASGRATLIDKVMPMAMTTTGHDLRHVHAVLKDRGLLRHRCIHTDVAGTHKLVRVDEGVAGRAKAVARIAVAIHPIAHTLLRRQRRPAHAIPTLTPCDPRRRPFTARHPHPAVARKIHPAAIMIGGPAKNLVRLPRPAERGPHPAAIHIRPPARDGDRGPPAVAVAIHVKPAAIRRKTIIKQ
ncbi:MAG: hypothetical protein JWR15_140 [Prosthecobacter sp.]|nr:hypothetical protein [Prosthecobacter sp.]